MAKLRLELLKEEAKHTSGMSPLSAGDVWSHKVSPSMFFHRAIDLEDQMQVLPLAHLSVLANLCSDTHCLQNPQRRSLSVDTLRSLSSRMQFQEASLNSANLNMFLCPASPPSLMRHTMKKPLGSLSSFSSHLSFLQVIKLHGVPSISLLSSFGSVMPRPTTV